MIRTWSASWACGMLFFFSSRRRHTRCSRDWSSDVCSSDLEIAVEPALESARAVKAAAVKPVKPRACADKHATREPLRSIIAVRRAGVRVIVIVAVGANRWRAVVGGPIIIAGAHAYAHKDSLRVRK